MDVVLYRRYNDSVAFACVLCHSCVCLLLSWLQVEMLALDCCYGSQQFGWGSLPSWLGLCFLWFCWVFGSPGWSSSSTSGDQSGWDSLPIWLLSSSWWKLVQMCRSCYCLSVLGINSGEALSLLLWSPRSWMHSPCGIGVLEAMPLLGIVVSMLPLASLGLLATVMLEQAAAGACCRCLLLVSAAAVPSAGMDVVSLLVFGSPSWCFPCILVWFAVWLWCLITGACSLWLMRGVCSLSFYIQQASLAYGLYKGVCSLCFRFSKLVLLLFWSRDIVPFPLYCWSPASFWSIQFLHLIKKKKMSIKVVC